MIARSLPALFLLAALPAILPPVLPAGPALAAGEAEPDGEREEERREPAATVYATATVVERRVDDATGAVQVEGRDAIAARAATEVLDVLPFVPGLSFVSGGTRGGLSTVQIRGGDPNFTRVLVDGVPVNDGTYQVGGVFDFEALPADAVERVEVVRGPLSAHYGSTGLAGAIQVITRSGEGPARGTARLDVGDAELLRGALSAGAGGELAAGFASLVVEEEEGRIADESFELAHFQGRGRARVGEGSDLSLAARLADWQADDYPDASGGLVFGSAELRSSSHEEGSLGLRFSRTASGERVERADVSVYRHRLRRRSPAVFPLVPASVEDIRFLRGRLGWAASWQAPGGESAASSLELSAGADVEWEDGDNESLLFLPPFLGGEVPGSYSLDRLTPGVYGELLLRRERLTLELDLRVDFPEDSSPEASSAGRDVSESGTGEEIGWRLGGAWSAGPRTRLRASVGRAFKLPSFFALASPPALGGNPFLQPETMVGADVSVEHVVPGHDVDLTATVFVNRFEDLVDFDFDAFTHLNRSEVEAAGAELAARWSPGAGVSLAANVTWQEVEDRAGGGPLLHRPELSGGLRADWRPAGGGGAWRLGADLRFASESLDTQIPVPERRKVDGHQLLGLVAGGRLADRWRLTLRLDNVMDQEYETLIGFPGPGFSARLGVGWTFGAAGGDETTRR